MVVVGVVVVRVGLMVVVRVRVVARVGVRVECEGEG